jgi:hypothetical protein
MDRGSAGSRQLNNAMTGVACAGAVAIPYWLDRTLQRWWVGNRPLAPFGTRYRRMQTRYRSRQDSLVEAAVFVAAIAAVIASSMPPHSPSVTSSA